MQAAVLKRLSLRASAALLTTVAIALPSQAANPPDLRFEDMAQADRDFAALSRAQGASKAFLTYLAQDSIGFFPSLAPARPAWEGPDSFQLDWSPSGGEISANGDFGYTYGPAVITVPQAGSAPRQFGSFYLTLWERDSAGNWKIPVDVGASKPLGPLTGVTLQRGPASRPETPQTNVAQNARLQQLTRTDRALARKLTTDPLAFAQYRRGDCVFLRNGGPRFGAEADAVLGTLPVRGLDSLEVVRMSVSGDLAFTAGVSAGPKITHYVRVWRYIEGTWRLVADETSY